MTQKTKIIIGSSALALILGSSVWGFVQFGDVRTSIVTQDLPTLAITQTGSSLLPDRVEPKNSSLAFLDLKQSELAALVGDFAAGSKLLTDLPIQKRQEVPSPLLTSKYLEKEKIEVDSVGEEATLGITVHVKDLVQDFVDKKCPLPAPQNRPNTLSGAQLDPSFGERVLSLDFTPNGGVGVKTSRKDIPISTKTPPKDTVYLLQNISIDEIALGKHDILVMPSCNVQGTAAREFFRGGALSVAFEKNPKKMDGVETASSKSLIQFSKPFVLDGGIASLKLPYANSVSIPFIQSSGELLVEASVDLNRYFKEIKYKDIQLSDPDKKTFIEKEVFSMEFQLYDKDGNKIQHSESAFAQDSIFNTSYKNSYPVLFSSTFSNVPKGEYSMIAKLIVYTVGDNQIIHTTVTRSLLKKIAIGDIIAVLGDTTVEGVSGPLFTKPYTSWLDIPITETSLRDISGRNVPTPLKDCELKSFFKDKTKFSCSKNTEAAVGMSVSLSSILEKQYGYPVLVLNEGMPEEISTDDMVRLVKDPTSPVNKRLLALKPNVVALELGTNEMLKYAKEPQDSQLAKVALFRAHTEALISELKNLLPQTEIYLAVSQDIKGESKFPELLAGSIKDILESKKLPVKNGPNLFRLFLNDLWGIGTDSMYSSTLSPDVLPNEKGYTKIAEEWAKYLAK